MSFYPHSLLCDFKCLYPADHFQMHVSMQMVHKSSVATPCVNNICYISSLRNDNIYVLHSSGCEGPNQALLTNYIIFTSFPILPSKTTMQTKSEKKKGKGERKGIFMLYFDYKNLDSHHGTTKSTSGLDNDCHA